MTGSTTLKPTRVLSFLLATMMIAAAGGHLRAGGRKADLTSTWRAGDTIAIDGVNHAPFASFGGWSGAVNAASSKEKKDAAYAFLSYMSAPEQSNEDVTLGKTGFNPYRTSQFQNLDLWKKVGMSEAAAKKKHKKKKPSNFPLGAIVIIVILIAVFASRGRGGRNMSSGGSSIPFWLLMGSMLGGNRSGGFGDFNSGGGDFGSDDGGGFGGFGGGTGGGGGAGVPRHQRAVLDEHLRPGVLGARGEPARDARGLCSGRYPGKRCGAL